MRSKSLRLLKYGFICLQRRALARPKITLSIFFGLLLFAFVCAGKLQMLLSIDDLIDSDFKTYGQLQELNKEFQDKNSVYISISPPAGVSAPSKAVLCDTLAWTERQSLERHDIERIFTSFGPRIPVQSGAGVKFLPILDIDCTRSELNESAAIQTAFQKITQTPWGSTLTSKDGRDFVVNLYLADTSEDLRYGKFNTDLVRQVRESFEKEVQSRHPEIRVHWAGSAVFQYYLRKGFDLMGLLNLLMMILLIVMGRVFLGAWKNSILFFLTVLSALILIYGGMGLTGCPLDVLTNALPLMLIIAAIEDYWFVCHSFPANATQGRHWRRPFRGLMLPGFFTSLTTLIGFGSLAVGKLGIIRRFGAWAAAAAVIEWVVLFVFLPALLKQYPKLRAWMIPVKSPSRLKSLRVAEKLQALRPPRWATLLMLAVIPLGVLGARSLHVNDSPLKVFPLSSPVQVTTRYLEETRGWQADSSLVFADFNKREFNQAVMDQIKKWPNVSAIENPYEVTDYLSQGLDPGTKAWVEMNWRISAAGERLLSENDVGRGILYLKSSYIEDINQMSDDVAKLCPHGECWLAGGLISYGEFGERILKTLLSSLGVSLFLVAIVLLYLMISLGHREYLSVLLSAAWGPLALLAVFYVGKFPVFYVSSMVAAILVGIAGDNTVQYLLAAKPENSRRAWTDLERPPFRFPGR